jgi:hypothetical protein
LNASLRVNEGQEQSLESFKEQIHGLKKHLRKFSIKTEHQPKFPQLNEESFIFCYTIQHLQTFSMI